MQKPLQDYPIEKSAAYWAALLQLYIEPTPQLSKGFLKNMNDDKTDHWKLVWDTRIRSLGVKGLTGWALHDQHRASVKFFIDYHGKVFIAELPVTALAQDGAKFVVANMAERLVAEVCEWLASGLEQMVNLLPKDWDGDRRPGEPANTWENLFEDEV
jgi:hypothetical protein